MIDLHVAGLFAASAELSLLDARAPRIAGEMRHSARRCP